MVPGPTLFVCVLYVRVSPYGLRRPGWGAAGVPAPCFGVFLDRPEKSAVRIRTIPSAAIAEIPRIGRLKAGMNASAIKKNPVMHTSAAHTKEPTLTPLLGASGSARMSTGPLGALHVC